MNLNADAGHEDLTPIVARILEGWGKTIDCDPGWWPLLTLLDRQLSVLDPDYAVRPVKEKFGGLRYYAEHGDIDPEAATRFDALIDDAEARSFRICERCGAEGRTRTRGMWRKTT